MVTGEAIGPAAGAGTPPAVPPATPPVAPRAAPRVQLPLGFPSVVLTGFPVCVSCGRFKGP